MQRLFTCAAVKSLCATIILLGAFYSSIGATQEIWQIGFPSPAAAMEALRENSNADFSSQRGWTVVEVELDAARETWVFTPESHAAHPAVSKRTIYEEDGGVYMAMDILCGASKELCDQLAAEFVEFYDSVMETIQQEIGE